MNEQLQQALAELLNKTLNGIDAGAALLQAELPEVIQQLLLWYAVKGVVHFVFGLFIICLFCFIVYKAVTSKPKDGSSNIFWPKCSFSKDVEFNFGWVCVFGFSAPFIFVSGLYNMADIMDSLQILVAPKVWLIEYAATLAKVK
ncbi:TMhelix containing protein [Vibrio phage MZH0603]|nr:TMhelix containing protein [Vibrio phage MZH0603]